MKISGRLSAITYAPSKVDLTLSIDEITFNSLVQTIQVSGAASRLSLGEGRNGKWFQWEYVIGEEITSQIFQTIYTRVGVKPWDSLKRKPEKGTFFQPLRRHYSKTDLDSFEFFRLFPNRWIARMGERFLIDDPVIVKRIQGTKKNLPIGFLDPHHVLGVSESVKAALSSCKCAAFESIPLEKNGQASGIYLLGSTTILPPCLLETLTAWGESYQTGGRGCLYEGGAFDVPELAYDRSSFPDVDVAVTEEKTGLSENDRFPIVVMSQRVRSILGGLGIKNLTFSPVRLLSPGQPKWEDPWAEIFDNLNT